MHLHIEYVQGFFVLIATFFCMVVNILCPHGLFTKIGLVSVDIFV